MNAKKYKNFYNTMNIQKILPGILILLLLNCNAKFNNPTDGAGGLLVDYMINNPNISFDPILSVVLPESISPLSKADVSISLKNQPASDITITVASGISTVAISPSTLTFTKANYSTPQTVSLTPSENECLVESDTLSFKNSNGKQIGAQLYSINKNSCKYSFTLNWGQLTSFMGIPNIDTGCNSLKPINSKITGTFKVMLSKAGSRTAVPKLDWVLQPNTVYISYKSSSASSTVISITDSNSLFTFPLKSTLVDSSVEQLLTGMNTDWTANANICGNWSTRPIAVASGMLGTFSSNSTAIGGTLSGIYCENTYKVLCVEQ